jgi:hypothetical protein
MARPTRALHSILVSAARFPRFDLLSRTGLDLLATGTRAHTIILTLLLRVALQVVPRRLPLLSQLLSKPPVTEKIALLRHLPSVIGNGRMVTTRTLSHPQTMRSARNWKSPIVGARLHPTACHHHRCRVTARKMARIRVALTMATTHQRQLTTHLPCLL